VVYFHPLDFIGRKRNVFVSTNCDDAAFARHSLVEVPSVLQLYRDHLIANAGFFVSFEMALAESLSVSLDLPTNLDHAATSLQA